MDDDSSAKSIDDLPVDVMYKIFSYLDHDSVKTATLVSKNWNEIISSSTDFLKETLLIYYDNYSTQSTDSIGFALSRKYQNVAIVNRPYQDRMRRMFVFLQQVDDIGSNLKSLHLNMFGSELRFEVDGKLFFFLDLLRHCPNIEDLNMDICWLREDQILATFRETEAKVKLNKLKKLTVRNFHWMLRYIECTKLETLTISDDEYNESDDQDHIIRFLNEQTYLNSLKLCGVNLDSNEVELSPKFSWKYLNISEITSFSSRNWKKLLESVAPDAKVTLIFIDDPTLFYEIMSLIGDSVYIKHLDIVWSNEWPDLDILRRRYNALIGKMNHISSLEICFSFMCSLNTNDNENIKLFISLFKKLHMFSLEFEHLNLWSNINSINSISDIITEISVITSLRHLKIMLEFFDILKYDQVPILPALETLEIHTCISDDYYCKHDSIAFFGNRHKTLRRLIINLIDKLESVNVFMTGLSAAFPRVQIFEVRHGSGKYTQVKTRQEIEST